MLLHSHAPHSPLNMSRVHIACFLLSSCSDLPFACFDIYSMPKSNWLLGVNLQQNFQRCGRVDGEKEERRNTLLHHIVYNNVPHHFCTLKRVALGCFLVSSTWKLPSSPAHFVMSTCIKHQLFKSGMTFLTEEIIPDSLHLSQAFFITSLGQRREASPSQTLSFELFAWVFSFFLSFKFFPLNLSKPIYKNLAFFDKLLEIVRIL